ncbi:unnamed protein product [Orchesella dallaii]|uniref:3'-5' exonuclease domain-containing protein n=1 Tax=Orchesella dallaii TaxID=48710 RepID=A0ABP1RMS7_9HEXA
MASTKMKNKSHFALVANAQSTFGVADRRPQDDDTSLLKAARRTNYGLTPDTPANYSQKALEWANDLPSIREVTNDLVFSMQNVILQNEYNSGYDIMELLLSENHSFDVLAVDFEFHNTYSYDGFICVASLSNQVKSCVVDVLNNNRNHGRKWVGQVLESKSILKVFCGCDNDLIRLKKDWGCFPIGVVDIQDLFYIWKERCFDDCFSRCKVIIHKELQRKLRKNDESACRKYLLDLQKPGLSFLMEVFAPHSASLGVKSPEATFADWRKRPIHPDLIKYAALDSFACIQIFHKLMTLVSAGDLKEAVRMCVPKLSNYGNVPRYVPKHVSESWIDEQLLKWREYLAKNLDMKPPQVISDHAIKSISKSLRCDTRLASDVEFVSSLLYKHKICDKKEHAAKLLCAYLENDGIRLERMRNIVCHNCNRVGHTAKFCFFEKSQEAVREFLRRPENVSMAAAQKLRRRLNWCKNRGLNPETTLCPWETGFP